MTGSSTVAERLAGWVCGLRLPDVPAAATRAAQRHLLDGIGTALAARRRGVVDAAVIVARGIGGPPEATLLGDRERIGAAAAAFGTGAMVHGLDFDDTHAGGLVHATAVVLPCALAVGEQVGASGEDVLLAAIAGYETVCRVAAASPHGFHARGIHATQAAGVFAAAAVAGRLYGLDAPVLANALGIAGSGSGGLLEFLATGAATKQLHPGAASMNGLLAARLAAAGATGPVTVFEGARGLYAALSARPAEPEQIVSGLGADWEVTRIGIKPYPSCQLMHAALDAAAALAEPVDVSEIEQIVIEVHPDSAAVVCEADKVVPRTPYDAKFSLPWSLAALLTDGRLDLDSYDAASLRRPEVAALAARVRTRQTGGTEVVAAAAPSRVEIRLRDGRTVEGSVRQSSGGVEAPMSDAALREKFLANAGGGAAAGELADRVSQLAEEKDLAPLLELAAALAKEDA